MDSNPTRSRTFSSGTSLRNAITTSNFAFELANESLDSRIVWHLAQECGISDGGQYEMVRLLWDTSFIYQY